MADESFGFIAPTAAPQPNPAGQPVAPPTAVPQAASVPTQQLEQRKAGWATFMDRIQNDPILQQQMLQTGISMMQGQHPGENFTGMLGRSLQTGNLAGQFLQRNQLQADQQQQQIDLEGERNDTQAGLAGAQIGAANEAAATSKQKRESALELFPQLKQKTALELEEIKRRTSIADLELLNTPEKLRLAKDLQEAQIKEKEGITSLRGKADSIHAPNQYTVLERLAREQGKNPIDVIQAARAGDILREGLKQGIWSDEEAAKRVDDYLNRGKQVLPSSSVDEGSTLGTLENPHKNPSDAKPDEYAIVGKNKDGTPIIKKRKHPVANPG